MKSLTIALFFITFSLLVSLGFWQLQRAEQKRQIVQEQAERLPAGEQLFSLQQAATLSLEDLRYQQVRLSGRYDCEHQILLDNKLHQKKPGFHVLTPFLDRNLEIAILVNRGWIPMRDNRQPDLSYQRCEQGQRTISGKFNAFPGLGYHFATQAPGAEIRWPLQLLELDAEQLSAVLPYTVLDYLMLLDADQAGGFVREWILTPGISAEKHTAYAVQWFGLAATLLIIAAWQLKKRYGKRNKQ